jgi:hypothetical protein
MLVRNYAGTMNLIYMARMNHETIHNAWQAQSICWFCRTDNRGPYSLRENLEQQIAALRYVASVGEPFEPNVPHHFVFRGADDATYVISGYIAARVAKAAGVRAHIAQNMLNTPKHTWGVQDLAKSRALLRLILWRLLDLGCFNKLCDRVGIAEFLRKWQVDLGRTLINSMVQILFAAVAFGLALAFGLGCKEIARDAATRWPQNLREKRRSDGRSDLEG